MKARDINLNNCVMTVAAPPSSAPLSYEDGEDLLPPGKPALTVGLVLLDLSLIHI